MNTENLQNNASAPDAAACREKINSVISEIEHVIVGKRTEIVMLMTAMLSGSHVLIEDVPGTGKTTLAAAIAKATGLDFRRAQFTPDVMASDITGFNVYNRRLEEFEFRKGLVMCNLLLADEINRAMTEALGREVYHYHLHVVYVPVVEKQILWSKRCKDKALVGTVKETVMQVSRSKKWASKPLLDESGKPVLQKNGKPILKKSYSVLQDNFFNFMRAAGYTDIERGERGSTEEHLTVTQFKVQREQERLDSLTAQIDQKEQHLTQTNKTLSKTEKELAAVQKKATLTKEALIHARDLDYIGKRTFLGNYSLTEEEFSKLKKQADHGYMMDVENRRLKEELSTAKKEAAHWGQKYHELWYEVKPYLDALHRAPELVRGFLEKILAPKQERTMNVQQRNHRRRQDVEL